LGQQVGVSTSLSFTDVNLAPATTYTYTVSAYDGSGNASAQSSGVTAKTFPDSVDFTTSHSHLKVAVNVLKLTCVC